MLSALSTCTAAMFQIARSADASVAGIHSAARWVRMRSTLPGVTPLQTVASTPNAARPWQGRRDRLAGPRSGRRSAPAWAGADCTVFAEEHGGNVRRMEDQMTLVSAAKREKYGMIAMSTSPSVKMEILPPASVMIPGRRERRSDGAVCQGRTAAGRQQADAAAAPRADIAGARQDFTVVVPVPKSASMAAKPVS
jgi:hypothetical protein